MKRIGLLLLLSGVLFVVASPSAMISDQVRIDTGALAGGVGATQPMVRVFKGIPYAAPPLGENRWRAPQPAAKWDGVRNADAFGAPCAAGAPFGGRGGGGARGAAPGQPAAAAAPPREPARSEDCLYLNVWTSATSANDKRPVMLWIYGGGFTGGSGGMAWYDGENLAAKGPVIVTINYRLGSLGFFAHPDLAKEAGHPGSGNYGMMDAIAALQWVKRNIAAFGGDPNKVTVAGESAGAIMVGALVGSPQAKGLFTRAIAESGGWMGLTMTRMRSSADAEAAGVKAVDALGVKTMAELRARPLDQLTGLASAGLVVDGYVIPEDTSLTFQAGKQNAVDVLTGSNKDEANFGICGPNAGLAGRGGAGMTIAAFKSGADRKFGEMAGDYLKLYPADVRRRGAPRRARSLCGRDHLEHAAVGRRAGEEGQEGVHVFLLAHSDRERSAFAGRRDAHRRDLLRVEQPEGPGDADVERRRHQARRSDVVLLGQLHHEGRSERQRSREVAGVQGAVEEHGDGLRRHAAGRAGGASRETVLLFRGVSTSAEKRDELDFSSQPHRHRALSSGARCRCLSTTNRSRHSALPRRPGPTDPDRGAPAPPVPIVR